MRKMMLATVAAAALGLSGAAFAAGSTTTTTNAMPGHGYGSYSSMGDSFKGKIGGNFSANDLMGRDIVDANGDDVGEIQDLLIDGDQVQQVLVDVGGFLGMGSKTVAIDIAQLQPEQGDSEDLVVGMTKDQLKALPGYEKSADGWKLSDDND
jgi:sporulation protein YlmC with PRC-barrel domain